MNNRTLTKQNIIEKGLRALEDAADIVAAGTLTSEQRAAANINIACGYARLAEALGADRVVLRENRGTVGNW